MKREAVFRIPAGAAPENLPDFLARRFTYHSRETWLARLAEGRVRVNGSVAREDQVLVPGDRLEYEMHDLPEPPVDTGVAIRFEDDDLLVVDKSGNLPCHPGGAYFNNTLWAILKGRFRLAEPSLVNRLDRETSGLVVVAKNARAAKACRAQFADRLVEKRYLALVEGAFPESLDARGAMRDDGQGTVRKRRLFMPGVTPRDAGSDWADTRFRSLGAGGGISLVEAAPGTGRLHQIRATLLACGFPVVGDKLYGSDPERFLRFCKGGLTEADRAALRMDRQALHAAHLRFRHPRTKAWLALDAPLPADMKGLMKQCGLRYQARE